MAAIGDYDDHFYSDSELSDDEDSDENVGLCILNILCLIMLNLVDCMLYGLESKLWILAANPMFWSFFGVSRIYGSPITEIRIW
ncbi:hypothetical protein Tco_1015601 [Tanacetum coccineum]|uniref:Uncharacterized protein n=1 Tax=Tanacetum coccineum TaxID=301880 RepID=A0ABQ5FLC1_9ASTR